MGAILFPVGCCGHLASTHPQLWSPQVSPDITKCPSGTQLLGWEPCREENEDVRFRVEESQPRERRRLAGTRLLGKRQIPQGSQTTLTPSHLEVAMGAQSALPS